MKFGPVSIRKAVGGILAHAVKEGDIVLKKGTVITDDHVATLFSAGVAEVTVALLQKGDVTENEAARQLAESLCDIEVVSELPFTGRVNVFAASAGVLLVDLSKVNAANAVDEAITIATLPNFKAVQAGELVATVKIIPFAVPQRLLDGAIEAAQRAVRVAPFAGKHVAVFSTLLPGLKSSVVDKTIRVLDARLEKLDGSSRLCDIRVHHTVEDLSEVLPRARALGAELVIVFGASAITDRRDVIPLAIEAAGGKVHHLGMPVDPGNLLLIGEIDGLPVIGAPGCARSPKENGFDWVMQRLVAGLKVSSHDIRTMGVGGLLMEITSRPQPRDPESTNPSAVAAVLLAAGQGTRMGGGKMTAMLRGKALSRHVAEAAEASDIGLLITVLGHDGPRVESELSGIDTLFVTNPDYAQGIASSLQAGVRAVPGSASGAIILLGDMPNVTADIINKLVAAFADNPDAKAVVPTVSGQRGNPVLLARSIFAEVMQLTGDAGARELLRTAGNSVVEVPVGDAAVLLDVDTPEALAAFNTGRR